MYPRTDFVFFISESLNFVLKLIMPQLTLTLRTKVVEFWYQTTSIIQIQCKLRQFFNKADALTARTIRRIVANFQILELFAKSTKGAVVEREALDS